MRPISILFLILLAAGASAEPFPVSPPSETGAAPGSRADVRLATTGETSLVVWLDQRNVTAIRGALLDRDRALTGGRDFLVSAFASSTDDGPPLAVATDDTDYLVAHSRGIGEWATRFTRVTAAGEVQAGVGEAPGIVRSLAYAGGHYFAVTVPIDEAWGRARLTIADAYGRVIRSGIPLVEGDAAREARLVATANGKLLVVWSVWNAGVPVEMGSAVVDPAALFDPAWKGAESNRRLGAMRFDTAAVAEGKDGFLIAAVDQGELALALLHPDGTVRSRETLRDAAYAQVRRVAVARVQDEYAVIASRVQLGPGNWTTASLRVTESGARPGGGFQWFSYYAPESMTFARKPDGWLTWAFIQQDEVWVAGAATSSDRALRSSNPIALLSRSVPDQEYPAVARCNGTNIVAWQDTWNSHAAIRLRRFSASGEPLDPPNRTVGAHDFFIFWRSDVSIVCGKLNALVTWREPLTNYQLDANGRVRGAILRPDGTLFDLGILGQARMARAAFDGDSFVVLAYDWGGRSQWLRRTEHGVRLATLPMLDFADELLTGLELAWNGSAFMVVTRAIRAVDGRATDVIHAREYEPRLLPAGAPVALAEDLRYTDAESPVLAARPGGWLASWWGCDARDCGTETSTLTGSAPVRIAGAAEPLQLSWNGTAFELLDAHGVTRLDEQGNPAGFHRLTYDDRLQAMAHAGAPRMYTFLRHDPASGTMRLYAGLADVTEPQRRRSARH